jgi:hypothetical protein
MTASGYPLLVIMFEDIYRQNPLKLTIQKLYLDMLCEYRLFLGVMNITIYESGKQK